MLNNRPVYIASIPLNEIDLKMPDILYVVIPLDLYYSWQNPFCVSQIK